MMFDNDGARNSSSYLAKAIAEGRTSGNRFTYMLPARIGR